MKKIALSLLLVLAAGCSGNDEVRAKTREERVHALDEKIERLRKEIKAHELKAMAAEVEGQAPLIDGYSDFAKKMEQVQKNEVESRALVKEVELLEQEKALLLKNK